MKILRNIDKYIALDAYEDAETVIGEYQIF
jgi:hypothetical protein